jgi:hypothetical protein
MTIAGKIATNRLFATELAQGDGPEAAALRRLESARRAPAPRRQVAPKWAAMTAH